MARHYRLYPQWHGTIVCILNGTALSSVSSMARHYRLYPPWHGTIVCILNGTALSSVSSMASLTWSWVLSGQTEASVRDVRIDTRKIRFSVFAVLDLWWYKNIFSIIIIAIYITDGAWQLRYRIQEIYIPKTGGTTRGVKRCMATGKCWKKRRFFHVLRRKNWFGGQGHRVSMDTDTMLMSLKVWRLAILPLILLLLYATQECEPSTNTNKAIITTAPSSWHIYSLIILTVRNTFQPNEWG